jgi:hypothetical protein
MKKPKITEPHRIFITIPISYSESSIGGIGHSDSHPDELELRYRNRLLM